MHAVGTVLLIVGLGLLGGAIYGLIRFSGSDQGAGRISRQMFRFNVVLAPVGAVIGLIGLGIQLFA